MSAATADGGNGMYSRAEMARRVGCNLETIRYYERIGLMPEPARLVGGRRVYDADALARLEFIRAARSLLFPIEDVADLLHLALSAPEGSESVCNEAVSRASGHLDDIRARIAELREAERKLDQLISLCHNSKDFPCALLDAMKNLNSTAF